MITDHNTNYYWAERIETHARLLLVVEDHINEERFKEALGVVDGYLVATEKDGIFMKDEKEVYHILKQFYEDVMVDRIITIENNLRDLIGNLEVYLSSNKDHVNQLEIRLNKLSNLTYAIGQGGRTVTNHDLTLYNLVAYPFQVKENNNYNEILNLVKEIEIEINNINEVINY